MKNSRTTGIGDLENVNPLGFPYLGLRIKKKSHPLKQSYAWITFEIVVGDCLIHNCKQIVEDLEDSKLYEDFQI